MKSPVGRNSRVTRRTSETRQSGRSSETRQSGRSSSGRAATRGSSSVSPYPDRKGRKRKCATEDTTSTKKSNSAQDPTPKPPRRMFNGQPGDTFCWICHKIADEFFCPDCPRVYHNKCLKKIKFNLNETVCECKWSSVDGPKSQPNISGDLKELLELVLRKVVDEKANKKNKEEANEYLRQLKAWPEYSENHLLCDIVDINFIVDKIKICSYKNTGQFFLDVKWMYHNCYIIKGNDHIMTTTAQKFEKAVKLQLSDMEACGECYREKYAQYPSNDFFANLCSTPHPVVWAKLKGFPFWPAKCLRMMNGHADVRFFGTHDKSMVQISQVYKISRRNPGGNPKKPKNSSRMTSYEESMAELSMYVRNYENLHGIGKFRYYNDKTPLEAVKLPVKKGRRNKNQIQLEDSMDTDTEGSNDQSLPHLNVSLLHDDTTETKASILQSSARAAMDGSVVCHMTFDAEGPNEMNVPEEVVEEPSCIQLAPQIPEQTGEVADDPIMDDPSILSNDTENVQISATSSNNANDSFSVPSSSTSPLVITSTHSLSNGTSDIANDPTLNFAATYRKVLESALEPISSPMLPESSMLPDGDDEIQIISESQQISLVNGVFKSHPMLKTFCELLLSNKPNVRNYVASFQNMALQFYLAMWLEANTGRLDANECKMFHSFCEKLCKAVETLKSQNRKLKSEVAELQQKLESEKLATIGRASLRDQIIKAQARKNDEDAVRFKTELNKIFSELKEAKKNVKVFQDMATKYEVQLEQLQQENEALKEQLKKATDEKIMQSDLEKQVNQATAEKENRIKDLEKQVTQAKAEKENIMKDREKMNQLVRNENEKLTVDYEERLAKLDRENKNLSESKSAMHMYITQIDEKFDALKKENSQLKKSLLEAKNSGDILYEEDDDDDNKNTLNAEKFPCAITDSSFIQQNQESSKTTERHSEVMTKEEFTVTTMLGMGMVPVQHMPQFMAPAYLPHPVAMNPHQVFNSNMATIMSGAMENHEMCQNYESHKSVEHTFKQTSSQDISKSSVRVVNKRSTKEQKKVVAKGSTKKR